MAVAELSLTSERAVAKKSRPAYQGVEIHPQLYRTGLADDP